MYPVYYLEKHTVKSNNYGIDRDEVWSFREISVFEDLEEAEDFVIKKNKSTSEYALWSEQFQFKPLSSQIRDYNFSLDPKYLLQRRWFIHKPNTNLFKSILIDDGIKVL